MHTYTNPFHSPQYQGSKPVITTNAAPEEYKGAPYLKLFAIKLSVIGADGTPEVVITALHSASAMDAAIYALGQYPALVSLSVKPVKE